MGDLSTLQRRDIGRINLMFLESDYPRRKCQPTFHTGIVNNLFTKRARQCHNPQHIWWQVGVENMWWRVPIILSAFFALHKAEIKVPYLTYWELKKRKSKNSDRMPSSRTVFPAEKRRPQLRYETQDRDATTEEWKVSEGKQSDGRRWGYVIFECAMTTTDNQNQGCTRSAIAHSTYRDFYPQELLKKTEAWVNQTVCAKNVRWKLSWLLSP